MLFRTTFALLASFDLFVQASDLGLSGVCFQVPPIQYTASVQILEEREAKSQGSHVLIALCTLQLACTVLQVSSLYAKTQTKEWQNLFRSRDGVNVDIFPMLIN